MRRISALVLMAMVLACASPALGVQSLVIQNVETSGYPRVVMTILASPDAVTSPGEVPEVRVTENGEELPGVTVSSLRQTRRPIDVVLLIDTSGSMKGRPLDNAREAASRFVASMGTADRIAVVRFASEPVVVQPFTSDRSALDSAISGLAAGGETALYDGLVRAAALVAESPAAERYIVALSDGGDTMSLNPPDNAATALTDARSPVYAVALESPEYDPATLETIARVSGGRMTAASDPSALTDIYASIAQEMQLRYRVEFTGTRPNTSDLEYGLSAGTGDAAATAMVTVRNPLFSAPREAGETLEPAEPSVPALVLSLLFAFAGVALFTLAVLVIFQKDKAALSQLRYYDQLHETGAVAPSQGAGDTIRGTLLSALGGIAERRGFTGLVQRWLDSAGIALRANEYILFHVLGTVVFGLLAQFIKPGSVLAVACAVFVAVMTPLAFLRIKAMRRLRAFDEQLPDILDLIAGSLRSGWGIQQAIDLVVNEVGDPARSEFRRTQAEARLGLPLEEALQRMAVRVGSADLKWVVSAIGIQREVGGNLAEVLNNVSRTIRERAELRRQVSALTAEGRLSLIILAALPFLLFFGLLVINPEYMMLALQAPLGLMALGAGGLLLLLGIVWLNRVMKIEV